MHLRLNQDSLKEEDKLTVSGLIPRDAERFRFDLGMDDKNLAFHMEVRFDQGAIILNTMKDGIWNPVEIRDENVFSRGYRFEVTIRHQVDKFVVELPQGKTMSIANRLGISIISMISISGDVSITEFKLLD